jgi:EAL domain-containing protein (putative c-di-GMP-specific phosphodiesterase class I)/AmiR/NasT family two-component response regulator
MPIRVLVADDHEQVRRALGTVIAARPSLQLVAEAADAEQAIELARRYQPDVALLDVRMPAGGGSRAAQGIARCSPGTRVVALSVYDDQAGVLAMLRAGAVGYLVKGATAQEITDTIERCARGEAVLAAEVSAGLLPALAEQLEEKLGRAAREHEWRRRVQAAIDGGLHLAFQPIVELATRRAIGFEALARLGQGGGPARWLERAAAVGLRAELELAALRSALSCLDRIPARCFLAVNLSPSLLAGGEARAALTAAPLERLVIELTEHAPVEDYEDLARALSPLRAGGLRVAVDDAGAGFASLRHVLRLGPDMIKVDRSLIAEIERDRAARALTSALVSFAGEMGQTVIAEGIETESALAALAELGVHYGQGYAIARPAPLPS